MTTAQHAAHRQYYEVDIRARVPRTYLALAGSFYLSAARATAMKLTVAQTRGVIEFNEGPDVLAPTERSTMDGARLGRSGLQLGLYGWCSAGLHCSRVRY